MREETRLREERYERIAREIGARIRARRQELGMSGCELARIADVRHSTIYRIEAGTLMCRLTIYHRIALALGWSLDELVGDACDEAGSREKERGPAGEDRRAPKEIPDAPT